MGDDAGVPIDRELTSLGVVEAAGRVRAGDLSSAELVRACLDRIDATDDAVRAWTTVDADGALAAAAARDDAVRRGATLGPLHGVPVGIKDIIDVAGLVTTAGAPAFAHTHPGEDAPLVARLRGAGAVILGKTVATAFAFKDPPPTRNPWDLARTPGGSSSGSAAAVAAHQVPAAIGTQTVGSILRPAAYCGVVGLKGASGAVPLDGAVPLAPSFDHAGPIARSVADVATLEAALEGRPITSTLEAPPRVGVLEDLMALVAEPDHRARLDDAVRRLEAAGAAVDRVRLPFPLEDLLTAGRVILEAEAAAWHAPTFRRHEADYPPAIADLVRAGLSQAPGEVEGARHDLERLGLLVMPLLDGLDVLVGPATTGPPPPAEEGTGDFRPCAPWSYLGVPAITLPVGVDRLGLPVGLQLGSAPGGLSRLLEVAARVEAAVAN